VRIGCHKGEAAIWGKDVRDLLCPRFPRPIFRRYMHIRHEGKVYSKESLIEAFLSFDNREPDKCLSKWDELAKWLENNCEMPRQDS